MRYRPKKDMREFIHALDTLADSLGGSVDGYASTRAGHIAFTLRRNGAKRKLFCSSTPSDGRWFNNALHEAKKTFQAMI